MGFSLSPAVSVSEVDLSGYIPAVGTTTGAIAGPFKWGSSGTPILVSSEGVLASRFGKPDNNTASTWFSAANFLAYGGALYVSRAVSNATVGGHKNSTSNGTGVFIPNNDYYLANYANGQGSVGMWAGKYLGDLGNGLTVSIADSGSYSTWAYASNFQGAPGTSSFVANAGGSNDEIHVVVVDNSGVWTGTAGTVLERFPFLSKCATALSANGSALYYAEVINRKSNYILWMDHPVMADLGISAAVNWGGVATTAFQTTSPKLTLNTLTGSFAANETVTCAATAVVTGGGGTGATLTLTVNSAGVITAATPGATGASYTSVPTVTVSGPGTGANIVAVLGTGGNAAKVVSYTIVSGGINYSTLSAKVVSFSTPVLTIVPVSGSFVVGNTLTGGTSSASGVVASIAGGPITNALSGGVDGNTALVDGDYIAAYDLFKPADVIDISLVMGGACSSTVAVELINNIAEFRKDCVAFLSPPQSAVVNNAGFEASSIVTYRNLLPSSSYSFMDSGWKYQYDKYNDVLRYVPLNGDIAGLCVNTDNVRDPWWSPAGYNRGFIKNVVKLPYNPGKADRDLLYQNGVNSIITERGQGTLLLGDKTMQSKPSAFDRLNVRRLFIVIEKAIATAAKYAMFELNDIFTQALFINSVTPYLRNVQGRRGIYAFDVVCDSTNNTPDVIDANGFAGDIYVSPAKSINFIQLNFVSTNTGVVFNELEGQVS